jgi:hypothetical protein
LALLVFAALVTLCGCKKKASVKMKAEAPIVVKPTLMTEAARLGLAGRIAGDVEFCVSSVQLKKHAEALNHRTGGSQTMAFVDDKAADT